MARHTILVEIKIDSGKESLQVSESVEKLIGAMRNTFSSAGLDVVSVSGLVARPPKKT